MAKKKKDKIKEAVLESLQGFIDKVGVDETEFMVVLSKGNYHCSICTDPFKNARNILMSMEDLSNENREKLYLTVRTIAASLLLCNEFSFHKDFEEAMADCLFESLQK